MKFHSKSALEGLHSGFALSPASMVIDGLLKLLIFILCAVVSDLIMIPLACRHSAFNLSQFIWMHKLLMSIPFSTFPFHEAVVLRVMVFTTTEFSSSFPKYIGRNQLRPCPMGSMVNFGFLFISRLG